MVRRLNKILLEKNFLRRWDLLMYRISHRFLPAFLPYYPKFIDVEVTTKCNLRCPGCERTILLPEFKNCNAPLELLQRLAPLFSRASAVSLVGLGEPLLNPNLWEIIRFIKAFGPYLTYTTNGTLLDEEAREKTFALRVDKVVISLDAATEKVYQKIRPPASFQGVLENIKGICQMKKARKNNLPCICLGFTIRASNIEEMPQFVELAYGLGVEEIWFTGFETHNLETLSESLFFLSPGYADKIFKETQKLAKSRGIPIRLPNLWTKELFGQKAICPVLWDSTFVFSDGEKGIGRVRFCRHFRMQKNFFSVIDGRLLQKEVNTPSTIVGDAMQESILKIWNNKIYRRLRKEMKSGKLKDPCKTCWGRFGVH